MALLTPQLIDVGGTRPTVTGAAALGDTIAPAAQLVLLVFNGNAAATTVTLVRPGTDAYGQANPDVAVSVPAGENWMFRVPPEFADTDGLIDVTYSITASVNVALVQI